MHIHILGICGTFMGSLALLARHLGFQVSGSDLNVYPPMSTQLQEQGIELQQGYKIAHLKPTPELIIIGNTMKRGDPVVEYVLNKGLPYTSGPQFFAEHILKDKWVLAVSGTHGKTTTSSMLAWILDYAGLSPGFLIGGIADNFGLSARMGETPFFVVEADEYDTAFFDKRSKFIHYHPRTLIFNNLEYDHADIFENLAAIQKQFHHLIRTIPSNGRIISPIGADTIDEVIEQGCWSELEHIGMEYQAENQQKDGSRFYVRHNNKIVGAVNWLMTGEHNINNALAAIAAARHVGVLPSLACEALCAFKGVKRRMELKATVSGVSVYDDFAHHPTAIATTLNGLRARHPHARIRAVIEPRSNTMKQGIHKNSLIDSISAASETLWLQPEELNWSLTGQSDEPLARIKIMDSTQTIIDYLTTSSEPGDQIVVMSNGGFENLHQRLIDALTMRTQQPANEE